MRPAGQCLHREQLAVELQQSMVADRNPVRVSPFSNTQADVEAAIRKAEATEGTVVVDFRVESEDSVYPMVPSGAALDAMIRRPVPEMEFDEI